MGKIVKWFWGFWKGKLEFIGEFASAFSDLPLWGRGTIRRMVDEVKTIGVEYVFGKNLTHRFAVRPHPLAGGT